MRAFRFCSVSNLNMSRSVILFFSYALTKKCRLKWANRNFSIFAPSQYTNHIRCVSYFNLLLKAIYCWVECENYAVLPNWHAVGWTLRMELECLNFIRLMITAISVRCRHDCLCWQAILFSPISTVEVHHKRLSPNYFLNIELKSTVPSDSLAYINCIRQQSTEKKDKHSNHWKKCISIAWTEWGRVVIKTYSHKFLAYRVHDNLCGIVLNEPKFELNNNNTTANCKRRQAQSIELKRVPKLI